MADWLAGDLSDDSLCGRDWLAGPRPPSTLITSHEYFNPITQHTQKFFSSSSCCQRTLSFCSFHGMILDLLRFKEPESYSLLAGVMIFWRRELELLDP